MFSTYILQSIYNIIIIYDQSILVVIAVKRDKPDVYTMYLNEAFAETEQFAGSF